MVVVDVLQSEPFGFLVRHITIIFRHGCMSTHCNNSNELRDDASSAVNECQLAIAEDYTTEWKGEGKGKLEVSSPPATISPRHPAAVGGPLGPPQLCQGLGLGNRVT